MRNVRLVARLDVKAPNLVKGIQQEGLRKLGNPNDYARKYYTDGIDEIYYEDIVASLYERNNILEIVEQTTKDVFVPVTVGGGLRTIDDVAAVLEVGADKVAINTAAIKDPRIITAVANRFGSQCMVLSIQAKRQHDGWEAYFDNAREHSGLDVINWVKEGEKLGAGEIILTSVDQDGTAAGFDLDLVKAVTEQVDIPVIASGGMGCLSDLKAVVRFGGADAVAMAHVLHYGLYCVSDVRKYCMDAGIPVRSL